MSTVGWKGCVVFPGFAVRVEVVCHVVAEHLRRMPDMTSGPRALSTQSRNRMKREGAGGLKRDGDGKKRAS